MSKPATPIVIRNLMPLAGWMFMAIWPSMLLLFTWLFFRDGGFQQFDPLTESGIMVLFWVMGVGGGGYLFGFPLTYVTFSSGIVHIRQRWVLRALNESFAVNQLPVPEIQSSCDNDGDLYFRLILTAGGRDITLREGNDRASLELLRTRLISEAHFQP